MPLIALLPGDGIGPEVVAEARRVLDALDLGLTFEEAPVGGAAYAAQRPSAAARDARPGDARRRDPVRRGRRSALRWRSSARCAPSRRCWACARSWGCSPICARRSCSRGWRTRRRCGPRSRRAIDMVIVRELTGDVYFGEKGRRETIEGLREGYDLMAYDEVEVRRIARVGFEMARGASGKLCSVDKANVLETSQLWRDVVNEVAADYPDVALTHMYVDNAAMQLVRNPGQFDVIVTGNLFGDILSDQASMCAGSIGMLPSASLRWSGARACTSRSTAPRPTSPGRARPIPARRSCRRRCCCAIRWADADVADRIEAAVARGAGRRRADRGSGRHAVDRARWATRCSRAL